MKKGLLFLLLCALNVSFAMATVTVGGQYDAMKTVTFTESGELANFTPTAGQRWITGATEIFFIGPFNDADLAALNKFSAATSISLDGATIASGSSLTYATNAVVKYFVLPAGITSVTSTTLSKTNCPALEAVASSNANSLYSYQYTAGTLASVSKLLLNKFGGTYPWTIQYPNLQNIVLSGNLNRDDMSSDYGKTLSAPIVTADLSNAVFADWSQLTVTGWGSKLTTFTFPSTITNIAASCMYNCPKVTEIVIPNSVTTIGTKAFNNMHALKKITIGSGVHTVGAECYVNSPIEQVIFVTGSKEILEGAFENISTLKYVTMSEGVISVGANAFKQCTGLLSISFPSTLKTIGASAFQGCTGLTTLTFPASVESIGTNAFNLINKLTDIYCLGTIAPKCAGDCFDPTTCYGDNSFGGGGSRSYYWLSATAGGSAVLHFPKGLTDAQKKLYTDPTRSYTFADTGGALDADRNAVKWPNQAEAAAVFANAYKSNGATPPSYSCLSQNGTTTYDVDYAGWHQLTLAEATDYSNNDNVWTFSTIKDNNWWTICVPFNMTKTQVASTFGDVTEICSFNGVVRDNQNYTITLKFTNDMTTWPGTDDGSALIVANQPYMIRPSKELAAGASYFVTGITKVTPDAIGISKTATDADGNSTGLDYQFIGNPTNVAGQIPQYAYFLGWNSTTNKAQFYVETSATATGKWSPYSCVLKTPSNSDDSFTARAKVNMMFESEVTGIKTIETVDAKELINHDRVFNMNGQLVRSGSTSLEGLPKGMYIVNGKKYIVR